MKRMLAATAVLLLTGVLWAVPISVGSTLAGQRFEWKKAYSQRSAGTYGQYEVNLMEGMEYEILTSNIVAGTSSDPYLYLLDTSGAVLAQDDDSAGSNNARIVYTPAATGTYWIRLRAYSKNRYGTCSLTLRLKPPPPPTAEVELRAGDVLNGQIFEWRSTYAFRSEGSYGQYFINMTAGTLYTFETSNAVGGGNDTFLYLLNSGSTVVKYDDDSGAGYLSKLTFQPSTDGLYYLRLRAYTKGATGTCTLTVTGQNLPPGNPLLPDLMTWVSSSYLRDARVSIEGGLKRLRFSNAVPNIGTGPLEVYGVVAANGTTQAYQVVHNDNGSQTTYSVGTFSFAGHESHGHWHYDRFSDYRLEKLDGTLVGTGNKVSFCLEDVSKYDGSLPGSPPSMVYTCSSQGISVGWADVYTSTLEGQWVDITGVPDGTYTLVSIVNPVGALHEVPGTNNRGEVTLTISGNSVTFP